MKQFVKCYILLWTGRFTLAMDKKSVPAIPKIWKVQEIPSSNPGGRRARLQFILSSRLNSLSMGVYWESPSSREVQGRIVTCWGKKKLKG